MLTGSTVTITRPIKRKAPPLCSLAGVVAVLPAYNEAERIGNVLRGLNGLGCRVVVVDDGSAVQSAKTAAEYGVAVLPHRVNRGQGAALRTGIEHALGWGAEVVVTMDADGQHDAADLRAVVEPILRGDCDVVLGSRFLPRARMLSHRVLWQQSRTPGMPISRRWLLKLAVLFTRWTTGLDVTDAHNGFRALSRAAAERLTITHDRMAHASDILEQIALHHWRYKEVPITVHYTTETLAKGRPPMRHAFEVLAELFFARPTAMASLRDGWCRLAHRSHVGRQGDQRQPAASFVQATHMVSHPRLPYELH